MVRFHLNGVWRKVIIDDTLPVDHSNRKSDVQSRNAESLWDAMSRFALLVDDE
jgi:hypothetical protein